MPIYDNILAIQGIGAKNDLLVQQVEESKQHAMLYGQQAKLLDEKAQLDQTTRAAAQAAQLASDRAIQSDIATRDANDPRLTPESAMQSRITPDPLAVAISEGMQTVQSQKALASEIRRRGGDDAAAQKAEQAAAQAQAALVHNMNLQQDRQKDTAKNVASAAGSFLPDGSNVAQVQAKLDALLPGWMKQAAASGNIDTDPTGTFLLPGKKTQAFLSTMQQEGIKAEDQIKNRQARMNADHQEAVLRQRKLEEDGRNQRQAQEQILAREGHVIRKDEEKGRNVRHERTAEDKAKEQKIPTKDEVEATASQFETHPDFKLPVEDAKAAAYDYHHKVNELMHSNRELVKKGEYTRTTAEMEAREYVKGKVNPEKKVPWYQPGSSEGASYDKWKQSEGSERNAFAKENEAMMGELAAVGVGSKTLDGKLLLSPLSNTPPAKQHYITKAQAALDTPGITQADRNEIMKRLKQVMVK